MEAVAARNASLDACHSDEPIALLASPERGARSESSRTLRQLPKCALRCAHADRRRSTARPGVPPARRREPPRDGRPPVARRGVRERARRTAGHVAAVRDAAPRRAAAQRPRELGEDRPRPEVPARARPDAHARGVDRRAPRDLGEALRPSLRRPRRRLLRQSELLGLRWQHVDTRAQRIRVRNAWVRYEHSGEGKSGSQYATLGAHDGPPCCRADEMEAPHDLRR